MEIRPEVRTYVLYAIIRRLNYLFDSSVGTPDEKEYKIACMKKKFELMLTIMDYEWRNNGYKTKRQAYSTDRSEIREDRRSLDQD